MKFSIMGGCQIPNSIIEKNKKMHFISILDHFLIYKIPFYNSFHNSSQIQGGKTGYGKFPFLDVIASAELRMSVGGSVTFCWKTYLVCKEGGAHAFLGHFEMFCIMRTWWQFWNVLNPSALNRIFWSFWSCI